MLHRSESGPVRKENEVALQWAEMRMVRWLCGIKLQDRVPSKGLTESLGLDNIISVPVPQQNRLRWHWHVAYCKTKTKIIEHHSAIPSEALAEQVSWLYTVLNK